MLSNKDWTMLCADDTVLVVKTGIKLLNDGETHWKTKILKYEETDSVYELSFSTLW